MTDSQEAILKEVCLKLGEHFDGFVLLTGAAVEGDDNVTDSHISYEGGYYAALGLVEQCRHDMVSRRRQQDDES